MLLQRLVADDTIGFNYDSMGAAEYEFGATRLGRIAIAEAYLAGTIASKRTMFVEKIGKNLCQPVEVVVLANREMIDSIGAEMVIPVIKAGFRTENPKIIGWMNVGHGYVEPMMIVRADLADMRDRINAFFRPFLEEMTKG